MGQPNQSTTAFGRIRNLLNEPTQGYIESAMKSRNGHRKKDDFIAPARRAFRRAARRLRAENAKLGLPLVFGDKGRVRLVPVR